MEAFRPTIRKGKKRGVVRKYWAEGQFYAMPFMGCVMANQEDMFLLGPYLN